MGRKVEMKKIEDVTKCQVTYSKRRSSLVKKANEISVCCDVDVAFVSFSPSGRLTKFSNTNKIEEVMERYVNLPAEKRYCHIKNVEEKLGKLRLLDEVKSDGNKLHHLNNEAEHVQLQITKAKLELQIVEANLRNFEADPEHDPSLAQLLWCERNLKNSLRRVVSKKKLLLGSRNSSLGQLPNLQMEMQKQPAAGTSSFPPFNGQDLNWVMENPNARQILMQLDPWVSPYSYRIRENILQNLQELAKGAPVNNRVITGISHDFTSQLPVISSSLNIVEPQFLPSYSPSVQVNNNAPILLNQQNMVQVLAGNSLGMLGQNAPIKFQHQSVQTFGDHVNNQHNKGIAATVFQCNSISTEMNQLVGANQIPAQNLNPYVQGVTANPESDNPLYTTTTINSTATTIANDMNNNNNNGSNCGAKENAQATQESAELSALADETFAQAAMVNDTPWTEKNQVGGFWDWDGDEDFMLPESWILEDLTFHFE